MLTADPPYAAVIPSPLPGGVCLGIRLNGWGLCGIDFLFGRAGEQPPQSAMTRAVAAQLSRYFRDPNYRFTLPLDLSGTSFQQRVWTALQSLPAGTTCSYGKLARRLGSGARAVAGACRANPLPLVIPCHRVVAVAGVGGYLGHLEGAELGLKRWLLHHEGAL